jgi:hypothetical protein
MMETIVMEMAVEVTVKQSNLTISAMEGVPLHQTRVANDQLGINLQVHRLLKLELRSEEMASGWVMKFEMTEMLLAEMAVVVTEEQSRITTSVLEEVLLQQILEAHELHYTNPLALRLQPLEY